MAFLTDQDQSSGHPLFELADRLLKRRLRFKARKQLNHVLELDDRLLDDVGVTRSDVQRALNQTLSQDAATQLYQSSLGRHARWM
ncbi:DUF1127 domain-containing protein [Rhodobacteraceae bacterium]|nr:DUF1127 domain-containing protein [Paracoccaceae bacterium]